MNKAEHNYRLLQEIEENRRFLLQMYVQNPELLKTADKRIPPLLVPLPIEKSAAPKRQRGVSLIELVMFIIIISVAVTGVLLVMNKVTGHSADSLIRKQALAIAESLLEEIELQDFISASGVTSAVTQANRATAYHIVSDYNGFATTGVFTPDNTAVSGLSNYNVAVAVAPGALGAIPAASAAVITVTVTDPSSQTTQATGYRTAY